MGNRISKSELSKDVEIGNTKSTSEFLGGMLDRGNLLPSFKSQSQMLYSLGTEHHAVYPCP